METAELGYGAFGACSGSKPTSNLLADVLSCIGTVISSIWRRSSTAPLPVQDLTIVPNKDTRSEPEIQRSRFVSVPCGS
jgi:hypothetical protein